MKNAPVPAISTARRRSHERFHLRQAALVAASRGARSLLAKERRGSSKSMTYVLLWVVRSSNRHARPYFSPKEGQRLVYHSPLGSQVCRSIHSTSRLTKKRGRTFELAVLSFGEAGTKTEERELLLFANTTVRTNVTRNIFVML